MTKKKSTLTFQLLSAIIAGLMFGLFSYGLFWTFLYIVAFEYFIYSSSQLKNEEYFSSERLLINVVFIFSWVLSRYLYLGETGFEGSIDALYRIWEPIV